MSSLDWSSCNWENITFHDRNLPRSIQYFNKSSIFVNESMPDLRLIIDGLISLVYYFVGVLCVAKITPPIGSDQWVRFVFQIVLCYGKSWSASDFVGQAHCSLLKLYDYLFVPYWIKNIVKRGKSCKICPAFVCGNVQKRGSAELISSEKGEDPMAAWKSVFAHVVPGKKRRLRRRFQSPCGQAVFCYEIYFA